AGRTGPPPARSPLPAREPRLAGRDEGEQARRTDGASRRAPRAHLVSCPHRLGGRVSPLAVRRVHVATRAALPSILIDAMNETTGRSFGRTALAVVVLLVECWILLIFFFGMVAVLFIPIVLIRVVVAAVCAYRVLF